MKKHIRLLSLTLSLVLLVCSAAPAFADYFIDPNNFAPANQITSDNQHAPYHIEANRLVFNFELDSRVTSTSVYHSGFHDSCLEYTANEGIFTWSASGDFNENSRTALWNVADDYGLAQEVTNTEDYVCIEIPMESPKSDYALYYGCWHYSVIGTYPENGSTCTTGISRVPHTGGIYSYVEY